MNAVATIATKRVKSCEHPERGKNDGGQRIIQREIRTWRIFAATAARRIFLRRNYDAVALAHHFEDGLSALAFAVVFLALADLRKTATRADAERFLHSRWFDTLTEGLELTPDYWRQLATRITTDD